MTSISSWMRDWKTEIMSISTAWKVSVFRVFWSAFSRILTEYGEVCVRMRTRKTPNTDTFHAEKFTLLSFTIFLDDCSIEQNAKFLRNKYKREMTSDEQNICLIRFISNKRKLLLIGAPIRSTEAERTVSGKRWLD